MTVSSSATLCFGASLFGKEVVEIGPRIEVVAANFPDEVLYDFDVCFVYLLNAPLISRARRHTEIRNAVLESAGPELDPLAPMRNGS